MTDQATGVSKRERLSLKKDWDNEGQYVNTRWMGVSDWWLRVVGPVFHVTDQLHIQVSAVYEMHTVHVLHEGF